MKFPNLWFNADIPVFRSLEAGSGWSGNFALPVPLRTQTGQLNQPIGSPLKK